MNIDSSGRQSRGFATVPLLATLAIAVGLLAAWTLRALENRRQAHQWHVRVQTGMLADAGMERALRQLRNDPDYHGETWIVAAQDWGLARAGKVTIEANDASSGDGESRVSSRRWTVCVQYPADSRVRAQVTRMLDVPSHGTSD
ncbi:MAG: hypothetical protein KDA61_19940 [Planctomycetales bacterium]|nr:hypothetical protein [Planctomycetales bacterium]